MDPDVDCDRHPLENRDLGLKYIYDYNLEPFDRRFERHWDLKSELEHRKRFNRPLKYPLTPLKSVRKEQWVQSTRPANTRFVFSDLGFDPEERRYGRQIETLAKLNEHWQAWR